MCSKSTCQPDYSGEIVGFSCLFSRSAANLFHETWNFHDRGFNAALGQKSFNMCNYILVACRCCVNKFQILVLETWNTDFVLCFYSMSRYVFCELNSWFSSFSTEPLGVSKNKEYQSEFGVVQCVNTTRFAGQFSRYIYIVCGFCVWDLMRFDRVTQHD